MIVHTDEAEAERILSILRNAQIPVRPSRCIDEDSLKDYLAQNKVDMILAQALQTELPLNSVCETVNRIGKDIPIVALLETIDHDSIAEAYSAGIKHFCSAAIKEQLVLEIINVFTALMTRRELRKFESDLNDAEKRCASLLDSSKDAIAYIHDGMHVYTNNAYLEFFKYDDAEEMEVTPFLNLVAKSEVPATKKLLRDISSGKIPDEEINMKLKKEDGEEMDAVVYLDKATVDGEPCVQFLVQPPKVNLEAEKELREMRNRDMLTGFYNRSYFAKDLSDKVNAVRSGKSKGHSLMYIQIDAAEKLEKELGRGNMDLLISDVAPFIKECIGEEHTFVRYDDHIFIVELEGQIEDAIPVAEHISKKIKDHFFSAGEKTLSITISIGLTQIIEKTETGNEVILILEKELEKSLDKGIGQISIFDPAEEEKKARAANQKWIDLITGGIENNQFILHYQPVISLHGDEVEHYETLVRLKDGDKTIMPADFIGVAKRHGLITDIDRKVVQNAIEAIKDSDKNVALFVKMSTDTLSNPSFPVWLSQQLKASAVSGEKLVFETPESELISHSKQIKPIIHAIKGLRCKFAIEKFGSGLNSFTLLKHYPVD
ncbi:MAG TPA: EAL domain-containing protein, partial [Oceanospirillales bacterium]|nr:EAL domain-containing protein [Oceanospirillales bacterium]